MKRSLYSILLLGIILGSFFFGSQYKEWQSDKTRPMAGRRILYYVDPMNPSHISDKPGLAPCGMKMEPVYADEPAGSAQSPKMPAGTVKISPEKQQLIGISTHLVEKTAIHHTLRLLGRVAADETRIYFINATVDGWITRADSQSTGSFVRKNEVLATFYSPEFLSAGQALLFALSSKDRGRTTGQENPARKDQIIQFEVNLKQYRDSLRNLGMGDRQIEEMIRTRKFMENVDITSPADGFILARNVSQGLRFDKGRELYRIADLSRVWILVDLFENQAQYFRPGLKVRVIQPYQKRVFQAMVSSVLPQFDAGTRTLKVRLEADNPDFVLRPDMFMDVEFPIHLPATLSVPADAILDSGLRKTVFIDRGEGFFEPRQVETGWRLGDRIEITQGLAAGERIVIAGNFLVDSESRMKLAAAGLRGNPGNGGKTAKSTEAGEKRAGVTQIDPVCRMLVEAPLAERSGWKSVYRGHTYYFCSEYCKKEFDKKPTQFVKTPSFPSPRAQSSGK